MRQYVKKFINSCVQCCYNKSKGGKSEGELHVHDTNPVPFYRIHIDHLGHFPTSRSGSKYVILVTDSFTKFTILRATSSTKSSSVLKLLNEISSYFGLPKVIVTDRGTDFTSQMFETYCKKFDIKHVKVAVRMPQANGQVERVNRTIIPVLKSMSQQSTDGTDKSWDKSLNAIQWSLNSTTNKTTSKSPHELIFNYTPRDILGNNLILAIHDMEDQQLKDVDCAQQEAIDRINSQKQIWKNRYDNKHRKPAKYEQNDVVVIENEPGAQGDSRKLEPKYRGPYRIAKVLPNDRYVVEDIDGIQRNQRFFSSVFAAEKIKPFCQGFPEFDDDVNEIDGDGSDDEDQTGTENAGNKSHSRRESGTILE